MEVLQRLHHPALQLFCKAIEVVDNFRHPFSSKPLTELSSLIRLISWRKYWNHAQTPLNSNSFRRESADAIIWYTAARRVMGNLDMFGLLSPLG